MPAVRALDRIEIIGFPAPGQQARLLRVLRDSNSGGYELLPEGTDLTDCKFLSARDLEPYESDTFKLAKIQFDPQTTQHQWFFLNVRANENAYNFETKYLDEASTKPVLIRTYVLPRAGYAPVAEGTADPVHSALKLIAQEQTRSDDPAVDALFVMVQRTYVELPGVVMEGGRYGDRSFLPPLYRTELEVTTEEQKVLPGAAPATGSDVLESEVSPETKNLSVRKTEKLKAGQLPKVFVGKQTGTWGEEIVTRTLKADNNLSPGHKVLSHEITPVGKGKYDSQHVEVPDPSPLVELRIDADTKAKLTITKTLVPAGTALPSVSGLETAEIQPIDKWNSIQIVTGVDISSMTTETFGGVANFSYPDVLEEIGIAWEANLGGDSGVAGFPSGSLAVIVSDGYSWTGTAQASAFSHVVGAVYTKIKSGHRGPVRVNTVRTYHTSEPTVSESVALFRPVNGTVIIKGRGYTLRRSSSVSGRGGTQIANNTSAGYQVKLFHNMVSFGPVLHSGVSLTGATPPTLASSSFSASTGSLPGGGSYPATSAQATGSATATLHIPSSTAVPTTGGTNIISVNVEKWRFGIWVKEVVTATHP